MSYDFTYVSIRVTHKNKCLIIETNMVELANSRCEKL